MAFKAPENVQETTTTTGTGTITLAGAVTGRFPFSSQLANGDTVFYTISDGTDLESGIGTYTNTSGQQLSRDTVLYSTNGGAKVVWAVGTRNVIAALAGKTIESLLDPGASNGLLAQTAARTYARRTLTAGSHIAIANGNGVSGNPSIALTGLASNGGLLDNFEGVADAAGNPTRMLFHQATAPTGWTRDISAAINDHALRIVTSGTWGSGSVGGSSGFTTVFGAGKSTGSDGAHGHTVLVPAEGWTSGTHANARAHWAASSTNRVNDRNLTTSSDGSHSHTLSLDLKYVDLILAEKG